MKQYYSTTPFTQTSTTTAHLYEAENTRRAVKGFNYGLVFTFEEGKRA